MRLLASASPRQLDLGLTMLRTVTGAIFAAHGAQKLFVFGFDGVTGAFGGMGVPLPGIVGPATAMLEFFGGLAMVVGLLTRPVAVALSVAMLGALVVVHLPNGFFLPNGYEFVLALFGAAATLGITGAGAWSIDGLIARRLASHGGANRQERRAAAQRDLRHAA